MQNIQDVFNRIQEKKKEQRNIKTMYRDILESSGEYREIKEKLEQLRARKKQLEGEAWAEAGSREKHDLITLDVKQDKEMLSDLVLSSLMKGEEVKIVDRDNTEYEPMFSVKFKKANVVNQSSR
jgi:hypothetical protein